LQPEAGNQSRTRQNREQILLFKQLKETTQDDEGKYAENDQAYQHAKLFTGNGIDKIGMSIGQHILDPTFAWTTAEQTTVAECFQRRRNLVGVA
jgi:hypothetical protein